MLERKKTANETILHYYYSKCVMIRKCEISDYNAVSCIIGGLPSEYQGSAKSGNYKTPDENLPNQQPRSLKGHICRKAGPIAKHCFFKPGSSVESNKILHQPTQFPAARPKVKKCGHCSRRGHTKEECWYLNPAKVRLLQRQVPINTSYISDVILNGVLCDGYIDTGSQINVADYSIITKLRIHLQPSSIVVKGFGDQVIFPKGLSTINLVDTSLSDIEVILGQPIINQKYVIMTV
nr:unnamed protein product [Callosobruchus analis]